MALFLADLNNAYTACVTYQNVMSATRRAIPFWRMSPILVQYINIEDRSFVVVPPGDELELSQVEIHSPGMWEFSGLAGVLQQIREYLTDRDERRKDREFRESAQREKMLLENELLQKQLTLEGWGLLRDELDMMKEVGISPEVIRQIYWQRTGQHLAQLGRHQDSGLIGRATNNSNEAWILPTRK